MIHGNCSNVALSNVAHWSRFDHTRVLLFFLTSQNGNYAEASDGGFGRGKCPDFGTCYNLTLQDPFQMAIAYVTQTYQLPDTMTKL